MAFTENDEPLDFPDEDDVIAELSGEQHEEKEYSVARILVDMRMGVQRDRIRNGNRLAAFKRGADATNETAQVIIQKYLDKYQELEGEYDKDLAKMVKNEPIFKAMSKVKGIGPLTAAKLIAMIDIKRAPTVSALWRYCGYAVIDGKAERPTKGEKLHFNRRLRTVGYQIGGSFLKSKSPYADLYYRARERYGIVHPDWTKLHIHMAALRIPIKIFLSHLWVTWRELENLPTRAPYSHEYLGHTTMHKKEDFGW